MSSGSTAPSTGRRLVSVLVDAADAPPRAIAALLDDATRQLTLAPELEATLALDSGALTGSDLAGYRAAGIDRVALRAGALDEAAQVALAMAAKHFPRCALDLTFARPGQSLADWRAELDRALELGAGHLSLEEGAEVQDPDRAAAFYELAQDHLGVAGLPPYEIAHFARPGQEARQLLHGATGGDYVGIGPGAAGRITLGPVCYELRQVGQETRREPLTPEQRASELVMTGLRLRAGIERAWFEPLAGPLETVLGGERLEPLIEDGFVALDRSGLRLTDRGWLLCDAVLGRLLG
jgi:oxygen-independent coproporphyrinogen-3 oxidase